MFPHFQEVPAQTIGGGGGEGGHSKHVKLPRRMSCSLISWQSLKQLQKKTGVEHEIADRKFVYSFVKFVKGVPKINSLRRKGYVTWKEKPCFRLQALLLCLTLNWKLDEYFGSSAEIIFCKISQQCPPRKRIIMQLKRQRKIKIVTEALAVACLASSDDAMLQFYNAFEGKVGFLHSFVLHLIVLFFWLCI